MNKDLKILFIGLGAMGNPMASHLIKAGLNLTVWDINPDQIKSLVEKGAKTASSVKEAAQDADVIITMIIKGEHVSDLYFEKGLVDVCSENALFIDMSTISPKYSKEHAEKLEALGKRHIDAPVSGSEIKAKEGTLAIFAAGRQEDVHEVKHIMQHMGNVTYVGTHGHGTTIKLCNNFLAFITIYGVAETMYLVKKTGIDPEVFFEAIKGGTADIFAMKVWGPKMIEESWDEVTAKASIVVKDNNLIEELIEDLGLRLSLFEETRKRFEHFCKDPKRSELDLSAIIMEVEDQQSR